MRYSRFDHRRSTLDIEDRLRGLKGLYEDGLISEEEYAQKRREALDSFDVDNPKSPTETAPFERPPTPVSVFPAQQPSNRSLLKPIFIIVAVAVAFTVLGSLANGGRDGGGGGGGSTSVNTSPATSLVQSKLLGSAWIGSGSYTLRGSSQATNTAGGFVAVAAKVDAPGAEGLCLFWRINGTNTTTGGVVGDTLTRQFSDWGSAASAGSAADQSVRAAKSSPEGRAVIAAAGC